MRCSAAWLGLGIALLFALPTAAQDGLDLESVPFVRVIDLVDDGSAGASAQANVRLEASSVTAARLEFPGALPAQALIEQPSGDWVLEQRGALTLP